MSDSDLAATAKTQAAASLVDEIIRRRRTRKILADPNDSSALAFQPAQEHLEDHEREVGAAIATSGFAPFHYDRRSDGIAEPWRYYWLKQPACRTLSQQLPTLAENMKPGNKLPGMLAACGSLVLVTWIPEIADEENAKLQLVNEEHLAASATATQNLLLALEARGYGTYWSSGGSLRDARVREVLRIPEVEQLIAAVFVDDPRLRATGNVESIPGKNHEKRSDANAWCREIETLD